MTTDDLTTYDTAAAWTLEPGDQIVVDGDYIEIKDILETDDKDEVLVVGYNYSTGDVDRYPLVYDDEYDLWSA